MTPATGAKAGKRDPLKDPRKGDAFKTRVMVRAVLNVQGRDIQVSQFPKEPIERWMSIYVFRSWAKYAEVIHTALVDECESEGL